MAYIKNVIASYSLFSTHFDSKHGRDSFQQPNSCDPSPTLCSVVFRSSFVRSSLLDLDHHGGNDLNRTIPLFYKPVSRKLSPKLVVIFRHLVKRGNFRRAED